MKRDLTTVVLAAGYIGTIAAAGLAVAHVPALALGYGVVVPAGVWFVAITLTLRDLLHDRIGAGWTVGLIVVGAAISWPLAGPELARASAAAFLIAELLDLGVYVPLRKRGKRWIAIVLSNTVGLVADSIAFVGLAQDTFRSFGLDPYKVLIGQIIGKLAVTLVVAWWVKRRDARRPALQPAPAVTA